ncbi:hypothetical protein ACQKGC_15830 [Allorhizobium pseudoryzae]|uniref:hypothetical protein n=1 Tax=Allorhizobium pseudoryzae TaxID=379684 RepID=UPI003D0278BD
MEVSEEHWFFLEALSKLNARFPIVRDEHLYYYSEECAKAYIAGWGLQKLANAFRQLGTKLTKAQKAQLGITSTKAIGSDFIQTLLPLGLQDPEEAARAIANAGAHQYRLNRHFSLCVKGGYDVRLIIRSDEGTCTAARRFAGAYCSVTEFKGFPLDECRKWTCRCTINRHVASMGGWRL